MIDSALRTIITDVISIPVYPLTIPESERGDAASYTLLSNTPRRYASVNSYTASFYVNIFTGQHFEKNGLASNHYERIRHYQRCLRDLDADHYRNVILHECAIRSLFINDERMLHDEQTKQPYGHLDVSLVYCQPEKERAL